MDRGDSVLASVRNIREDISKKGWSYLPRWHTEDDGGAKLVELASCFGTLLSHDADDGVPQVLTATRCDDSAPMWEPFNRPEAIGWHNDYSTWPDRPDLSFVWIVSTPPPGEPRGDWVVASCDEVVAKLGKSKQGRASIELLSSRELPFWSPGGEHLHRYRVLTATDGMLCARYYDHAIRRGLARSEADKVPAVERALAAWSEAADAAATRCNANAGALFVCDNWRALHGRAAQATGRRAWLCAGYSHAR